MSNYRRSFAAFIVAMCLVLGASLSLAAEEESLGQIDPGEIPKLQPASDKAQRAIAKMRPAPGLKVELYAAEPLLANPVALNFDNKGRCYVIETWRLHNGVIDIRGNMDWLDEDLACKTVEDRLALVRRKMGPNARTFAQYPDVIRLLQDTDGDGKADKSTVFAEFHDMADGLAAGLLPYKGGLFVTNIPNLWWLKDTHGDGHADIKQSLQYGYGIRYNFIGHDLHGPRFGPDGKLYFSIGDRAANVIKTPDNRHVQVLESGAVFRCNPDGTGLEIYATGLRNPQSLAFDDYGNLFTGDNNPDYGDPARWVYVVEDGDSGWRVGYQYDHNPIGGGPWMWEKLWITQDKSTANYLLPPIADLGAGPSGVTYYPGTGLSHAWDNHFFEVDFRGGFTGSGVHSFVMKPKGAGFEMTDLKDFIWDSLATDIVFGPRGGAYITDWVEGWDISGVGRIYHVFDPKAMADPVVAEVSRLLADGFDQRPTEELVKLLAHRDQRVRQGAQFALAERGDQVIESLARAAGSDTSRLARIHAIWGLGQIADKSPWALDPVLPLLTDQDDEIRAQAARVLGDHRLAPAYQPLIKLLKDRGPRVRYFAAMGLARLANSAAVPAILDLARENADQDVYIRHAAITALTRINDSPALRSAAQDNSPAVRMAVLLTMRRLHDSQIAQVLHDSDPRLVLEAARAINDLPIEAALPQLAKLIEQPGLPDFVMLRVINANYRVGTGQAAAALARFAADPKAPERWRAAALRDLADWQQPGQNDRVTMLPRPLPPRDPALARDAAGPHLASILHGAPSRVRVAALEMIQKLGVKDSTALIELVNDSRLSHEVRESALRALAIQNDPKLPDAVNVAMKDRDDRVRAAAIEAMARLSGAVPKLQAVLLDNTTVRERQAAFAALAQAPGEQATDVLRSWMDKLIAHQVPAELQLDVLEAAEKRQDARLHELAAKFEQSLPKSDPLAPFRVALQGGDATSGDKIFHERADASCLRCHTVHGTGGIVGPVLDGIGAKQSREYLLESIVLPNAKIAPGFESAVIRLKDGTTLTGVVRNETPEKLDLIDANGQKTTVVKSDIDARHSSQSAMPEGMGKVLSKRDLRDLVEYLAGLKK